MIGLLRGRVVDRTRRGEVLVDVGGVGYRASVTPRTLAALGTPGSEVVLHTHLHVREDALVLFGFPTAEERECFEALIGARGVGPALALAILSVHSPSQLARALAEGDVDALTL
ncbi:MAG TPA: Holliday junction branch migration protein RuvA, partial [Acidimicrobiales bacterium]